MSNVAQQLIQFETVRAFAWLTFFTLLLIGCVWIIWRACQYRDYDVDIVLAIFGTLLLAVSVLEVMIIMDIVKLLVYPELWVAQNVK